MSGETLPDLLDTKQVAALLRLTPRTIINWRNAGVGPAYIDVGRRIYYRPQDVARFLDKKTVQPVREAG